MRKIIFFRFLLILSVFLCALTNVSAQSFYIDNGWKFIEGDVEGAEKTDFDDSKWTTINLPHDWDIYHSPIATGASGNDGGYYNGGVGWYRKCIDNFAGNNKLPSLGAFSPETRSARKARVGERLQLLFEGVYQQCKVYINGKLAGTHGYGYTPFSVDISKLVKGDGKDVVAVRVDNSHQPNCRWYSGSGIYRRVSLRLLSNPYIKESVITTEIAKGGSAKVLCKIKIENPSDKEKIVTVSAFGQSRNIPMNIRKSIEIVFEKTIENPRFWSPSSPYLYKTEIVLSKNGKYIDKTVEKYGIRYFSFDSKEGFKLNGKKLLINGACLHHDNGVLGAAAFKAAEIRRVKLMKEAGFNLIRTSHNPPSTAFLDACDSLGMLVIDEIFDGWSKSKTKYDYSTMLDSCYKEDIAAMVLRDRNHPSIICWSIGNEVIERKDIRVVQTAKDFKKEILKYDTTRPVTEALCAWDKDWEIYDPHAEVLDIVGYNYMIHKHSTDHERCPERVMWQTESYPRDAFKNWELVNDYPYIVGDIVWTGMDYLGEASIGGYYHEGETAREHYQGKHFPWHGAYCGDVDITGWRKPISHYRQILWDTETPRIHMAVREPGKIKLTQWAVWPTWESWNWEGWEGKEIEVEVASRCASVRLYLNGKLMGEKPTLVQTRAEAQARLMTMPSAAEGRREVSTTRKEKFLAVFKVPYTAGTLIAEGLDNNGKIVMTQTLTTAGEPYAIRLTPDKTILSSDGQDLCFITVEVVDKNGNLCPNASVELSAFSSKLSSVIATGSADMTDTEPYTSPHFKTWKGRGIIVVRSGNKSGSVSVKVKSQLKSNIVKLKLQ